jgi:AcrR family transcriptional regulator
VTATDTSSTPRRREIVAAARGILERDGGPALTMRALAAQLGMKAPSLYKHFPDKQAVELALIVIGFEETGIAFEEAVGSHPASPVEALANAYRSFARAHPHLYRLMTDRPLPRERLPEGVEARAGTLLIEAMGSIAAARAAWGMAHGLVMLEINGRFPPDADVDAAWAAGVAAMEHLHEVSASL